uniref:Uncharacterized protein n=1 Tax=Ciona intestinalis TaxID=7719 RepID=H2XR93_CIOIN
DISEFGSAWGKLPTYEKEVWNQKAAQEDATGQLSEKRHKTLIKQHLQKLEYECSKLEELGVSCGGIAHHQNSVSVFGNNKSVQFIKNDDEFIRRFIVANESNLIQNGNVQDTKEILRQKVQQLFNKKYGEFLGKASKFPYKKLQSLEVVGLPKDTILKPPSQYGIKKLQDIMLSQNDIFIKQRIESPVS